MGQLVAQMSKWGLCQRRTTRPREREKQRQTAQRVPPHQVAGRATLDENTMRDRGY